MAVGDMIENSDQLRRFHLAPCCGYTGYGDQKIGFLGLEKAVDPKVFTEIILRYRFPPATCDEAQLSLQMLKNDLKAEQEKVAGGNPNVQSKSNIAEYNKLISQFSNWISQARCVQSAINEENTSFTQQVLGALNNETAKAGSKSVTTWLIIGGIGLAVIISGVLIFRKR